MASSEFGIEYHYEWDVERAVANLEAGAMMLDSYINSALVTSSWKVKEEMESRAPEGVGATYGQGLKGSITREIDPIAKRAEIKPTAPYAAAVEYGSRPHMPPVDPDGSLAQWCELKGMNLWAVAMHIKHYGTKAHPYVEPTWQATKSPVLQVFNMMVSQWARSME